MNNLFGEVSPFISSQNIHQNLATAAKILSI